MSKVSNKQRLECLKIWSENQKYREKKKVKKQPLWIVNHGNNED
jgi:hypothetical protein